MGKKKRFKCTSEAQKKAIRRYYATQSVKSKAGNIESIKQKPIEAKSKFKLPLVEGGHRWNLYNVPNIILNGKNDGGVHGGLVVDEKNNNVLLVEVTHSPKDGKRNNINIRNLTSGDLDEDGHLRSSYMKRSLVFSIETKDGKEGIDIRALKKQMNDLNFTREEKIYILEELSNLSTAESKYKEFLFLAENKKE